MYTTSVRKMKKKNKNQNGGFYIHPYVAKLLGGGIMKKKRRKNKKIRQNFSYKK